MHKFAALIALAASAFALVRATVPLYGQCGGSGYTGETVCTPPATCVYLNYWYSQCLILTSTATASSTTTTPTISYITTTTTPKSTTTATTTKTTSTTTTSISYIRTTTTGNYTTTTTTPTKTTTTSSTVACYTDLPTFSPAPVRANTANTSVTGLYLHRRSDGKAVLNKNIAGIPLYWTAPGTIALLESSITSDGKPCQVKDFLNVHADTTSPAASYKPLQFDLGTPISDYWSSVHLSVTSASPWGAQSWFLACPTSVADEYLVYLQTGTDVPSGQTCTLTQLS